MSIKTSAKEMNEAAERHYLFVAKVATHSLDSTHTLAVKTVVTVNQLVEAHNKLVRRVLELEKNAKNTHNAIMDVSLEPIAWLDSEITDETGVATFKGKEMPLKPIDSIAFMTQFGHICKCVAPMPAKVTGPGHIEVCLSCKKLIVEDDRD